MSTKTLKVNIFSVNSLENLKDDLKAYRNSLDDRVRAFVDYLLSVGIETAQSVVSETDGEPYGSHQMGRYVTFTKKIEDTSLGCRGILIAKGETLESKWFRSDGEDGVSEMHGAINALLAVEFGTAAYGLPPYKGTNSQSGHANDTDWWFAKGVDKNGKLTDWQHATAITPTRPLHRAFIEMEKQVEEAAKRNF